MSDVSFYVCLFFQVRSSLELVFFSWAGSQQAPEMPPVSLPFPWLVAGVLDAQFVTQGLGPEFWSS